MTTNLDSFTDVLDDADEIDNSQPLSLSPEENDRGFTKETAQNPRDRATTETARNPGLAGIQNFDYNSSSVRRERHKKHTGQHGDFRSVEEIDPKYREVFSYPYFNLVQSSVIEDALYSDKSMVVCAPTGSGKTVVFEMAIVQLLMALDDCQYTDDFKIIYMAPVKALCTERLTEWYSKFTKLGILCIEVTGDTDVDFSQLKPYRIIITTPEKWDMLTRRWRDHKSLVSTIKLFLIDEVHILNDESRGPVLEAVVSRMKTIESSFQSAHRIELLQKQYQESSSSASQATDNLIMPGIRFVAVSATVANPHDVAAWLGTKEKPAVYYKFGDECRPVKLTRVVEGYPCGEGCSIFKFDIILNYKLWPIIYKYHDGKPTLIFCNTRKSVALTAEALSKEVTVRFSPEQKAKLTALATTIKNKKLQSLVLNGVGCHHAGLLYEERLNIEQAFRNRDLPILITTTTLAMGVNLPAHLVIIKNTQQYVNGQYQEYSISTVLQMVGRAGRPQFDNEATAVIMTRMQDKARYQALVGGDEPLQSYLHKRLAENLNSEAALGTVNDVAQCVQWLRSTFLCVRAAKDPKRYLGLTQAAPAQLITKKLEELCVKAMNSLASSGLISMDEASCIETTEAGRLMSVYYLDLETMKHIMKINGSETLEKLLWLICESHELADMHLRVDERRTLNLLNRNNAAATIRYTMKGKISSRQMKLYCIIQAVLGCLPIPDPSLNQEAMKIMRIADRVCKCLVAYVTRAEILQNHPQYFTAVLNSIILTKCIASHLWENSPYVSKQLKGIGPTFSALLASAGKSNFLLLEESHPRDLERIMNKGPPAGNVICKQVGLLPKYQLTATPVDENTVTIQLMLLNQAHLSENMDNLTAGDNHKSYIIVGDSENHLLLLTPFKDKDLMSVYDGTIKYDIKRIHNFQHKMIVHCVSSNFVGIDAQCDYTFKDVAPLYSRGKASFSIEQTPKTPNKIQTNITDTYKQRKRKNADNDIGQSKEKIKRETKLVEKFKNLKESFGAASKNIKASLHKTSEMTDQLIHDNFNHTPAIPEKHFDNSLNASYNQNTAVPAHVRPVYETAIPENLNVETFGNTSNAFGPSFNHNTAAPATIRPVYEPTFINASEYKLFIDKNTVQLKSKITKPPMMVETNQNDTELIPRTNEYFTDDIEYPEMIPDNPGMVPDYPKMVLDYPEIAPEDNDGENFIVDDHIEDILSEIENEISKSCSDSRKINIISDITLPRGNMNANLSKPFAIPKETTAEYNNRQLKDKPTLEQKGVNLKSKLFTRQENYKPVETRKRKPANLKSNYSFIDTIEKQSNDESEEIETVPESKSGFSDAIKKEIEKFLNNAKISTNTADCVVKELVGDDGNVNKNSAQTTQNEKDNIVETKKIPNDLNEPLTPREIDISELPDVCVDSERKINHPAKDQNAVNDKPNCNMEMGEDKRYSERKINPKSIKDTCDWLQTDDIKRPTIFDYSEEWSYPSYKQNTANDDVNITNDIEMEENKHDANCALSINFNKNNTNNDYHFKKTTNIHYTNAILEITPQYAAHEDINNNEIKLNINNLDVKHSIDIKSVMAKFDQRGNEMSQGCNIESETEKHAHGTLDQYTHQEKPKTDVKSVIALYDLMRNKKSETSNNMDTEFAKDVFENNKNIIDMTKNNLQGYNETIDLTVPTTNKGIIDLTEIHTHDSHVIDLTANNHSKNNSGTLVQYAKYNTSDEWKEPENPRNTNEFKSSVEISNSDISRKPILQTENINVKLEKNYKADDNSKTVEIINSQPKPVSEVHPYSSTNNRISNKNTGNYETAMMMVTFPAPRQNIEVNRRAIDTNNTPTQYDRDYAHENKTTIAVQNIEKQSENKGMTINCYPYNPQNLNNLDKDRTENTKAQDPSLEAYKAYLNSMKFRKDRIQHSNINKDKYVNKYSFTGTKIDVTTKNTREHQVQIIKRLKIDLDVTEIISKTNTQVNNNEKKQQESRAWYSDSVTRTKPENLDNVRLSNYFSNAVTLPAIDNTSDIIDENVCKSNNVIERKEENSHLENVCGSKPIASPLSLSKEQYNDKMKTICNFDDRTCITDNLKRPMLKENTIIDREVQDATPLHDGTRNNEKFTSELIPLEYIPNNHKINNKDDNYMKMNNYIRTTIDKKEIPNDMKMNNNVQTKIDKKEIPNDMKMNNNVQTKIDNKEIPNDIKMNNNGQDKIDKKELPDDKKIKYNGQNKLHKHDIENENSDVKCNENNSKPGIGNNKVNSILEKYGRILKKNTIDSNTTNLKNACFRKEPEKPKRPFKISEIHKADVALPKTLEVEVSRSQRPTDDEVLTRFKAIECNNNYSTYENAENNFEHEKTVKNDRAITSSSYNTQNNFKCETTYKKDEENICVTMFNRAMSIDGDKFNETSVDSEMQSNAYGVPNMKIQNNPPLIPIHDEIPELDVPSTQSEEVSVDYNYNDDLDTDMFNPKALLQRFTDETIVDTSIIPPPMEFCDDDIHNKSAYYSPTICNDNNDQDSASANTDDENDYEELEQSKYEESYENDKNLTENVQENQDTSIFEEVRNILTPSKEIETWTFSTELETAANKMCAPQKSCTVMRNNPGVKQMALAPVVHSRKAKLGQFRIPYKEKFTL